jgi:DNA-directed RNA polymerase subunit RPC12/RpoP
MMDLLEQTNRISGMQVHDRRIAKIESDGYFDILTVAFNASSRDEFISEKYRKLNSGGQETFVEYWSFIKKRGVHGKSLYDSNKCPGCGGELPEDATDVSRCPYCSRLTNTGEYDWILAEITQADDFLVENTKAASKELLNRKIMSLVEENPDFSVQFLEDRASNAFLQMIQADVQSKPEKLKRFLSDSFFQKSGERGFFLEKGFLYNRLYLNNVVLVGIGVRENRNLLAVSIKMSSQRVKISDGRLDVLDPYVISRNYVLIMERDRGISVPAGSVFSFSCPHCGGELRETTDIKCQYCGEPINSTKFDWVVTDLMTAADYQTFSRENRNIFEMSQEPDLLTGLYHVRDFAFNNVLIMLASDGRLEPAELAFAEKTGKKWGYSLDKLAGMLQMAQAGRLPLRMPEAPKDRKKIYKLMEKAAMADQHLAPEEQALLEHMKTQYRIAVD